MASIYVCSVKDRKRPKVLELSDQHITEKDIDRLKKGWPKNISGIYFTSPDSEFLGSEEVEIRKEDYAPRVAVYMLGIADKLRKIGQLGSAFKFYDLANAVLPNPQTLLSKARVLFDLGSLDKAKELLDRYLKENPEDGEAYYLKGRLALSLNEYSAAKVFFKKTLQLIRPQNVDHLALKETATVYLEFTSLLVARDTLHTYNYTPQQYCKAIGIIKERALKLVDLIEESKNPEISGVLFSLEHLVKTCESWKNELQTEF